jgi:hypothetical protein
LAEIVCSITGCMSGFTRQGIINLYRHFGYMIQLRECVLSRLAHPGISF